MRYAYVKNGDALEQVQRIARGNEDRSGPDAFVGDFVRAHRADEVLVLSASAARGRFRDGNLRAERYPSGRGTVMRGFARAFSALRIGFAMLLWRPDRILCGCTSELLWTSVAVAKLRGIPIVTSAHGGLLKRGTLSRLMSALDRASFRASIAVVSHGPFLAEQVRSMGVDKAKIHEFEVDLSQFADLAAHPNAPDELQQFARKFRAIVMYVGRVQRDKGVIDLLDAFCASEKIPASEVGLVYIGDGIDMPILKRAVTERRANERVLLLGRIPHNVLPGAVSAAAVVVTPTRPELSEGRCMAALEAMVVGVPVIAPDFAAFPYLIHHDVNGLLYEPGSVESLSRCLEHALNDETVLETLRQGARETGLELTTAHKSFSRAVDAAFAMGSDAR